MAPKLDQVESNVSNEVVAGFAIEAERAQREIDQAAGRKRAILKRAKAAGVNTRALLSALSMKRADPEQVRIEMRDAIRYAGVLAPTVALDRDSLFDGLDTRQLNSRAEAQVEAWEAERAGYEHGLNGGAAEDCPYAAGDNGYGHFQDGWQRGQAAIAARMAPNEKQADASRTKRRGRPAASNAGRAPADGAADVAASSARH